MKKYILNGILWSTLLTTALADRPLSWTPEIPTKTDPVTIRIDSFQEGDTLHWALIVDETSWVRPLPAYRPADAHLYGNAVRMPFRDGEATIGPFDQTNQIPGAIVFAVLRADGTWDNNNGDDYLIPISAGRITFAPASPTANDLIEVTVHDSRPGGYLRWGANETRGIWTGVDPVYWPVDSIMGADGVGLDSPLPDPDAEGRSILHLGPFNQGNQFVRSIHMAVQWDEEWDTDGGRNYSIELQTRDPAATNILHILEPATGEVTGESVQLVVAAPEADEVDMWLNGRRLGAVSGPPFTRELLLGRLPYGPHELVARSVVDGVPQLDAITFWHVPTDQEFPAPPNLAHGATDNGDGTVTFALYAPGKKFVSLVGDFNCWNAEADRMLRSPDGMWWLTRELPPGTYHYQYDIEGAMRLGDPYAREVDWTNADGEKGWMPKDAKTVLRVGTKPFQWTANDYVRPALEDLVIYELYIEDMAPGEGFAGLEAKLDYIQSLGANAIEPMPWHPWPGEESWGYNPTFHFAVEQLYGRPDDLKRLIDAAHQRGMAVIIDMVLNHAEWGSPLYQLYAKDYANNPYFREYHGHNWGFPKIDQESPAVKRYVADVIRFWIEEYRIDGFRYDATRWTGWQGYNDWGASWYAYVARQADPESIQIAEHLPIEPPLITDTEMDTGWHAEYRWRIREMITGARLNADALAESLDGRMVGFEHSWQRIPYTESHDEERVVNELREAGFDEDEIFRRATMAVAFPLLTPGLPMIYSGQEFGEDTAKNVGWNPLNWEYLEQPRPQELWDDTRALIHLRVQHPALKEENLVLQLADENSGAILFKRSSLPHEVQFAGNIGPHLLELSLHLNQNAQWQDVLSGTVQEETGLITVTLEPGEVRVWATTTE
jgi:1,4-alpha-glucan branching enzyme